MKKYKFLRTVMLFGALIAFGACSDSDDTRIFNEDPIHRINAEELKIKSELVSSEYGWVVNFFPNNEIFGGYSFLYKFNEDNTVWSRADVEANNTGLKLEKYNFVMLGTIALNFPENALVHLFPAMSKGGNQGKDIYHTDIEFLFDRFEDGDIVFKGHTTKDEIRLIRATSEDAEFDLTKKNRNFQIVASLRNLIVLENGEVSSFNFRFGASKRFATVLSADKTMSVNGNGGVGVGATNTGIIISPAIEFEDGSSLSELTLEGNMFKGEVNGNIVIIQ